MPTQVPRAWAFFIMIDIRRLKSWPELQKAGFVPIRYTAQGMRSYIGASFMPDRSDIISIKHFAYTFRPGVWDIWSSHYLRFDNDFNCYNIPSHKINTCIQALLAAKVESNDFTENLKNASFNFHLAVKNFHY
jgi:hypothetical protein